MWQESVQAGMSDLFILPEAWVCQLKVFLYPSFVDEEVEDRDHHGAFGQSLLCRDGFQVLSWRPFPVQSYGDSASVISALLLMSGIFARIPKFSPPLLPVGIWG
jgi:hypothetical protein